MSHFLKCVAVILSVLALAISPSHAQSDAWQVVELTGAVRMAQPMATAQPVSTGGTLNAGAVLSTGIDGRAVLVRGEQQIIVGPNSRMSLPAGEEPGMTRVLQDLGTLLFKVDKREKQHFQVETPVIAAVVKGTTFTVTAGADAHAVHVAEGAVEVSSRNGMARELVTAGRTARILRGNPGVIQFIDTAPRGTDGETSGKGVTPIKKASFEQPGELTMPAAVGDAPLDFAELTEGLVQSTENRAQPVGAAELAKSGNVAAAASGNAQSFGNAVSALRSSTRGYSEVARLAGSSNGNPDSNSANGNGPAVPAVPNGNGPAVPAIPNGIGSAVPAIPNGDGLAVPASPN